MNRITIHSKVGSDGVLQVSLPVGAANADQEVQITVEPISRLTADEWRKSVLETAGKWQGEFERPDQGNFERRDPLS